MRLVDLGNRLAARTLELIDIPSESREEARLAAHVTALLDAGGVPVRDLGDTCVLAGTADALAGGWRVAALRVTALEDRLTRLETVAPDETSGARARQLRDAVRAGAAYG